MRISNKSVRFRSKNQIAGDIAIVLNADLTWGTKCAVLADAIWTWSEFEGKFDGCLHWTPGAWKSRDDKKRLTHEHVVPKVIIIDYLSQLQGHASRDKILKVMNAWCIGVVVLRSEDKLLTKAGVRSRMPPGWTGTSPWARYELVGLEVVRNPGTADQTTVIPR